MNENLAFQLNGETHYYKNVWEKIEDNHYPECPTSIAASHERISTFCVCSEMAKANAEASAEDCA